MKKMSRLTGWQSWIALGVLAIGAAWLPAQQAMAQYSSDPLLPANPQSGDGNNDPFSGQGGNQSSSMLDLIHRATMGNIRTPEQFQQDQQGSLGSEARNFRNRQRELLQQQQQQTGVSPQPSTQPNSSSPISE